MLHRISARGAGTTIGPGFFLRAVRTGMASVYAMPVVLFGRTLFFLFLLVILSSFWAKVAGERVPGGLSHLLPPSGLALYIGITEWVTLSTPAVQLRLEDDVRSGILESRLLRPKSHLLLRSGEAIGGMLARMSATAAMGVALLLISGTVPPPPASWAPILLLSLLGAAITVLNLTLVGLCAFWMRRVMAPYLINQKLSFLLGGLFAPVTVYPAPWDTIAAHTPYAASLFWPAQMALAPTAATFVHGLVVQLVWLIVLGFALAGIWSLGVRRVVREGM